MDKQGLGTVNIETMSPHEFRMLVRTGAWHGVNTDACLGYAQANLVVVPESLAFDFFKFCHRNPQPCPVIEVTDPGQYHSLSCAPEADLRADLPKYRVFENGEIIDEPHDIQQYWNDDSVAFLLGCSTNFDYILRKSNVKYRYIGDFKTSIDCVSTRHFQGSTVVSTRLFRTTHDAVRAIQITSRNPAAHGPPVHIGNPEQIGVINDNYLFPPTTIRIPIFFAS